MNLNWFKFEPAKWAMGRISKQKDAVAGAFVRLMCKYWSEGCDMTPEDAELETGAAAYKSLVDAKILKIVAGKAHINFLDEQWKKELEKHENRKEWGAKGGHRKAEKAKPEDTPSQPLGSLEDTHSIPLAESSRREKKRREENTSVRFSDFWDVYDKKTARPKCETMWLALSELDRKAIMLHIPLYKQAQPNKKFRKNPETYLRNRSWEDEVISSSSTTQANSKQVVAI